MMDIRAEAEKISGYVVEQRRWLHAHPELSFKEKETTDHVAGELDAMGVDYRRFGDYQGLLARIRGKGTGRTVLLRADLDGLALEEDNDLPYRSCNKGVMHACGHDTHTAMLLGAARILQGCREELAGDVLLLFQSGEESGHGAAYYVDKGLFDGVDGAMAIHVMPHVPEGRFNIEAGPRMASCTDFRLTVTGRAAHGSTPHLGEDAIVAASSVILNLQTAVSRLQNPLHPLVVSLGTVRAGTQFNIIADRVEMTGTIRAFDRESYEWAPERVRDIASGIAAALGCRAEFRTISTEPVVLNDRQAAETAARAAEAMFGPEALCPMEPLMGSEDFSLIMEKVPGVLCILGVLPENGTAGSLHAPDFRVDDRFLYRGSALYARFARDYLENIGTGG